MVVGEGRYPDRSWRNIGSNESIELSLNEYAGVTGDGDESMLELECSRASSGGELADEKEEDRV